jgi:hypothetical protein
MVNQLNKFSPNITELTKSLRELLKVDKAWIWDTAQENEFQQIKHELASSGTLSHYDPNKESIVSAVHHHLVLAQLLARNEAKVQVLWRTRPDQCRTQRCDACKLKRKHLP